VTRTQQAATKKLEMVQQEFLVAYGWAPVGKHWTHPKLKTAARYTLLDAMAQTRAEPTLGWP